MIAALLIITFLIGVAAGVTVTLGCSLRDRFYSLHDSTMRIARIDDGHQRVRVFWRWRSRHVVCEGDTTDAIHAGGRLRGELKAKHPERAKP